MTTKPHDSFEDRVREEFHEWCMSNPATDALELTLKLVSCPDFFMKAFNEEAERREKDLIHRINYKARTYFRDKEVSGTFRADLVQIFNSLSTPTSEDNGK